MAEHPGIRRAVALAAWVAAAAALVWAAPGGSALPASARWGALRADAQLAALAAAAAWLVLGWLVLAATVSAAAHVPGAVGRAAGAVAGRMAPSALRRVVEAGLGIAVSATLIAPAAAFAAPTPPRKTVGTRAPAAAAAAPRDLGDRVYAVDLSERLPPQPDVAFDRPAAGRTEVGLLLQPPRVGPVPRPAPPLRVVQGTLRQDPAGDGRVVVRAGDSLWVIAGRELGPHASTAAIAARWHQWYAANRAVIGADPDLIRPGTRLVPPAVGSTP